MKIVPKARIIFAIIFTAFFLSCDFEDNEPDPLEQLFFQSEEISGSITITSPNGGESWEPGSSHAITWSSANLSSSNVTIKLYKNGSYNSLLSSYTTNDGSYAWTISSSLSESDYYKIRIEEYNNSSVYDESDNYFTISSSGSSGTCDDCLNDYTDFGSECCDTAWEEYSLSCAELESTYGWDCSGCNCPGDSDGGGDGEDPCSGVSCDNYCSGDYRYYNGDCTEGSCYYSIEYCSNGCSNGSCNSGGSNADCSDAYYCSDCYGCESNCCPNYCSGNYYYYNRSCSNEFCVGATSTYCPNGCNSSGCN